MGRDRGHGWRRLAALIADADRFVRIHFLFFSCLWPLLGAISVQRDGSIATLVALTGVAVCFHLYAFVLNDIVDLPIDRTQPLRARDPLVRGAITPRQALALVAVQPPLAAALTAALGGGARELAILLIAFGTMTAYNLWGKRCPVPPVTDFVQGIAWGSLPVYAAYTLAGTSTAATWLVAAYAVGYTLFMNGVHGGLRDLANDAERGARTTAIFLGARPGRGGRDPSVPLAVGLFTSTALAVLVAIEATLLIRNDLAYDAPALWRTALAAGAVNAGAIALMPRVVTPRGNSWDIAFRLQIYLALVSLPIVFVGAASGIALALLALLNVVSLAVLEWTGVVFRLVWQAVRRGIVRPQPIRAPDAGAGR